ncbi:vang-like protein 2 [Hetaerina americana]|uniref:vang-like protein 2 n=1 Tax=Hetaerina americana TaxID=62018 RepID=UPI003A7F354E
MPPIPKYLFILLLTLSGMETESVKSTVSEQSSRSRRSRSHHHHNSHHHGSNRNHSHRSARSGRSLRRAGGGGSGGSGGEGGIMAPFQTTVSLSPDDGRGEVGEVIEVQILPQDDNWGENTTALTSERSASVEDVTAAGMPGGVQWRSPSPSGLGADPTCTSPPASSLSFFCQRYLGILLAGALTVAALISPLAMVILPKLGLLPGLDSNSLRVPPGSSSATLSAHQYLNDACNVECKGSLVALAFKLVALGGGAWAVFLRRPHLTAPRICLLRSAVLSLGAVLTFAFWLFYIVHLTEAAGTASVAAARGTNGVGKIQYAGLVAYASTLTDTLLFVHYLAVVLIEIRHLQPTYYIKVVRSPDGESRSYAIGELSIQSAAAWILDRYYTEFPIYNPYLERLPASKSRGSKGGASSMVSGGEGGAALKFYDVDGSLANASIQSQSRAVLAAQARRRDSAHNERFYEEHDYERRVRKRRARLLTAAEEAFAHIRRLGGNDHGTVGMDCDEAAAAVFPGLARALQKYLRLTRQQPRHPADSVLGHLANCLRHGLSPRAFLEPFLVPSPVLQNEKERGQEIQTWALVCGEAPSRPLSATTAPFHMRQGDISLLVTVSRLPHLNLTEEVVHPKSQRFALRLNSETSV